MATGVVTTKGQVVIPAELRKKFHIKPGTRVSVYEKDKQIVVQPITREYIRSLAGILPNDGKSLTSMLLKERAKEKYKEDKID